MNIPNNETVYNLDIEIMENSFVLLIIFSGIFFLKFFCCSRRRIIDNETLSDNINSLRDREDREEESEEENLRPLSIKIETAGKSENNSDDLPSYSDIYPEKYQKNN